MVKPIRASRFRALSASRPLACAASALCLTAAVISPIAAATAERPPTSANTGGYWDVSHPPGRRTQSIDLDLTEGTWMDVDVSPDGQTLAFSLLGDLYVMPIGGGEARNISSGLAWEVQPRFSPDGSMIAFTSDRGGADNIWVMKPDGTDKRQITVEQFRTVNQPAWSPDGASIIARKHFTTERSLGTGELWQYFLAGGSGVALVKRSNPATQKELGEPVFAAQGNALLYTRDISPGAHFEYAQNSNLAHFAIERLDLATREVTEELGGLGGATHPAPSPDGQFLAFIKRDLGNTMLAVRNQATGEERNITQLDRDMQENWAVAGIYPNMAWLPDSKALVVWNKGHLWRYDSATGDGKMIPFHIRDKRELLPAEHYQRAVASARETRMLRDAHLGNETHTAVFESLGHIYATLPGHAARRLTDFAGREFSPSISRDGKRVVFVQWTDEALGKIAIVNLETGAVNTLPWTGAHIYNPRFSPDGAGIAFEVRDPGPLTAPRNSLHAGIYFASLTGDTAPVLLARDAVNPHFGIGSDRVFANRTRDGELELVSYPVGAGSELVHARGELASRMEVDPQSHWILFDESYRSYLTPLSAQTITISAQQSQTGLFQLPADWTSYAHWSSDGKWISWLQGPSLQSVPRPPDNARPSLAKPQSVDLSRPIQPAENAEPIALVGGKVVTMSDKDGGIVSNGVVLIEDGRITAVGSLDQIPVPARYRQIDCRGKFVIPGLIDAHAHGPSGEEGVVPEQNWVYLQALALGITTIHDPANSSTDIFYASELQSAGMLDAPRIFSSGDTVYGAHDRSVYARIDSLDDALAHVRRLKAQGAFSIKNYNQPRRAQRQQIIEAARREGMMVVAEGGAQYGLGVTHIIDGNATLEHNLPVENLYRDVETLIAGSNTNNTPTLVVTFGGPAGDPYWRQATNITDDPLLRAHTPPAVLRAAGARRVKALEEEYVDDEAAREARKFIQNGQQVAAGGHGQQAGISLHWDIWSFERGGFSPLEAIGTATIAAARSLGLDQEIGSIEPGKLADIAILDRDPTLSARNSNSVKMVVQGGRLYDARTLNEITRRGKHREPYWWEQSGQTASKEEAKH